MGRTKKTNPKKGSGAKQPPNRTEQRTQRQRDNRTAASVEHVSAPVAVGTKLRNTRAMSISMGPDGKITIRHRELIAVLSTPGSLADPTPCFGYDNGLSVQPGTSVLFPWLSYLAQVFDQYTVDALGFEFVPMCPTSTPGEFMLCLDTDAGDARPTSEIGIMSYKRAMSSPVWASCKTSVARRDLHPDGRAKYVRTVDVPTTADKRVFDAGNVWIFTTGAPASTKIGYLYATYTVTLSMPQLPTTVAGWLEATWGFVSQFTPTGTRNVFTNLANTYLGPAASVLSYAFQFGRGINAVYQAFAFATSIRRDKKTGKPEVVEEAVTTPGMYITGLQVGGTYEYTVTGAGWPTGSTSGCVHLDPLAFAPAQISWVGLSADPGAVVASGTAGLASTYIRFTALATRVQVTFSNPGDWWALFNPLSDAGPASVTHAIRMVPSATVNSTTPEFVDSLGIGKRLGVPVGK